MEPRRILLAVTGGIAAYKTPELVRVLVKAGHSVRCTLTPEADAVFENLGREAVLLSARLSGTPGREPIGDLCQPAALGAHESQLGEVAPGRHGLQGIVEQLLRPAKLVAEGPVRWGSSTSLGHVCSDQTRVDRPRPRLLLTARRVGESPALFGGTRNGIQEDHPEGEQQCDTAHLGSLFGVQLSPLHARRA